ncbi:hypothetical protein BU23DRAFT_115011 [Bimuria novae-zelandiae CBS 107.79]|uniref:Uncharacterized protein n=1 Tax=Bimuria novae-zelandiae CBS 107.79 TaxID=1447943 RepID=A0A6A5VAY7_9PLEO|nr:hypothetical protein BU23DRAFT_115011 [Bimuria novae-zelandiae CBS 107.79]
MIADTNAHGGDYTQTNRVPPFPRRHTQVVKHHQAVHDRRHKQHAHQPSNSRNQSFKNIATNPRSNASLQVSLAVFQGQKKSSLHPTQSITRISGLTPMAPEKTRRIQSLGSRADTLLCLQTFGVGTVAEAQFFQKQRDAATCMAATPHFIHHGVLYRVPDRP